MEKTFTYDDLNAQALESAIDQDGSFKLILPLRHSKACITLINICSTADSLASPHLRRSERIRFGYRSIFKTIRMFPSHLQLLELTSILILRDVSSAWATLPNGDYEFQFNKIASSA